MKQNVQVILIGVENLGKLNTIAMTALFLFTLL